MRPPTEAEVGATRPPAEPFGAKGASHDYSGVIVLRDVDFELKPGRVHGLVGENGSGKSTLIKILTGAVRKAAGELYLGERTVNFSSPVEAQDHGIAVVHQDYHLFPDLSVAQNVFGLTAGLPRRRLTRTVDKRAVRREVHEQLEELGIEVSPTELVAGLGAAERKFVEIARAMRSKPRFLILDEPTASLEPQSAEAVMRLLDGLRAQHVGLCLVSHRLDEVLRVSDFVSVLRDGQLVARHDTSELNEERLVKLMISEEEAPAPPTGARSTKQLASEAPVLRIRDLRLRPKAEPFDLDVSRGEVLGLAGLLGSGTSQIVRLIAGADPHADRGGAAEIEVAQRPVALRKPGDATRLGIGYIPEDRKGLGLIPEGSMATNIALASLRRFMRRGRIDHAAIDEHAESCRAQMRIRCASTKVPVRTLSGGNQQKVLIARWLTSDSRILAIEEPTHGVDVGGKAQILQLLRDFADRGGAVVVASTEARDLLELCDRVAVLRHGELVDVLNLGENGLGRDDEQLQETLEDIMVGQAVGAPR